MGAAAGAGCASAALHIDANESAATAPVSKGSDVVEERETRMVAGVVLWLELGGTRARLRVSLSK
jgi:hypothetical protein